MTDMFSVLVPGLPDGFVDSLRKAVLNDQIDRAENLMQGIGQLLSMRQIDPMQAKLVMKAAVLSGLSGAERRRAESVFDRLSWPSE